MNPNIRLALCAGLATLTLAACSTSPHAPSSQPPAAADVAYLTQLGLMRGHLHVGMNLYRQGHAAQAASHMKHPSDELYAGIEAGLASRGADGFAAELETLAVNVKGRAGRAVVEHSYSSLLAAIARAEAAVDAPDPTAMNKAVVLSLLAHAAEEYQVGVRGGHVHDVHEYQDAWGFTEVAISIAPRADDAVAIKRELGELAVLWPELVPASDVPGDGRRIKEAAQRLKD